MFNFIKEKLQKIYSQFTSQLQSIFSQETIDQASINQIEELLLKADTGTKTTQNIISQIRKAYSQGSIEKGSQLHDMLHNELKKLLIGSHQTNQDSSQVFLLVGINGSGKTTFAGKLANYLHNQGKSCLIAAADTFRAAAPEQLKIWAHQAGAQLLVGKQNQDPASVVFDACEQFKHNQTDTLIIDTAGRLQTKENLMKELEKIKRIIVKQLPNHKICTLLTVDGMLGQNSLQQAQIFHESTKLDGIILTKMDGSAKGGIVFSIIQELGVPIAFIAWGEHIEDIAPFNSDQYLANLLGNSSFQSKRDL